MLLSSARAYVGVRLEVCDKADLCGDVEGQEEDSRVDVDVVSPIFSYPQSSMASPSLPVCKAQFEYLRQFDYQFDYLRPYYPPVFPIFVFLEN